MFMKAIINLSVLVIIVFVIWSCGSKKKESAPPPKGSIIFWTPNLAAHGGYVDVTIDGLTKTITANWTTPPPNCLSTNGVAYFYLDAGSHNYSTVDFFGFRSTGTVTVVVDNCNKNRIE